MRVWIYDKVSTDRVDTSSSTYAGLIILGANSSDHSSSQRQRTLTIIIKYDEEKKVRDFAYNSTQFLSRRFKWERESWRPSSLPWLAAGGERVCSAAGSTG